jgi:alpha-glucosidase (family GH31 glycosyl hydrolase)
MRRALLPLLLLLAVPAPAAAAGLRSGPLRVRVDRAGTIHVAQRGGAGLRSVAGSLRFHTARGWVAGGRRAVITLARGRSGVVALRARLRGTRADAVRIAFAAPARERYYGFGERSTAVAQRGTTVENYVSDGPFSPESADVVQATIPPAGFRRRRDATYYPVPWLLSGRGYGVLVGNDETSWFRLPGAHGGSWGVRVAAPELRLRFFAGPTPARALARFTAATGRQPAPAAPWAFGPWLQTGQPNAPPLADQVADYLKLRRADAPVSAAETQLRYLPCGLDKGLEAYERDRVAFYHRVGLAVLTYVNPMLCRINEPRFSEARSAGALLETATGAVSVFGSFVGGVGAAGFSVQPVGEYDFTKRAGRAAYDEVLARILRTGHDGWMEDFGEYTPLDARAGDGRTGTALHNRYPALYHCGVARLTRAEDVVRFQRSGWTGAARCAQDVWGGDPTTTFGFDGLSSAVRQALSMGLSGVSRWGSDIGGYDTIGTDPKLDRELLERWIELGAVSGVMRIKKSGLALPAYTRPQVWDPAILPTWRRFTKLHTQLYPYIRAADAAYRRTGIPLMRALVLDSPRDRRAAAAEDEFRFGPDLLAAPVVARGRRSRAVYLPRGRWLDAAKALRYDPRHRGAYGAGTARTLRGGRTLRLRARLGELPLLVRSGAVLPMLSPDVSTLAGYRAKGVVRLADRRDRLRLLAFPAPGSRAAGMFEGERLRSSACRGRWTLRIAGARSRRYTLEAATAALGGVRGGRFRVDSIRVGGRPLPRSAWSQPHAGGVLRASFRAKSATVVVTGR